MNSKSNAQIFAGHANSVNSFANPLTSRLAALRARLGRLKPVSRAYIALLFLLLVASLAIAPLFPLRVSPASTPLELFSGQRAMAHLPVIAAEPHPAGSPAQARLRDYLSQELRKMGLEVEVQRTRGLENVIARLHGSDPTGAIVILAHYDTVSGTLGAGDNGSTVAALLEIMRALAAGPGLRNDVIALFDDGEESADTFSGTKAFIRTHPWMKDVRLAISIDTAVFGFISTNEVGPDNNGWLVHALARAYTGGSWMSFSGGGEYNSTPFRNAGIPVIALEDNYPWRQKHTTEDVPAIIRPASVQQLGEQTVSITRQVGSLDLIDPWGEQETFFSLPLLGFIHYPQDWSLPLAISACVLLAGAFGLAFWRRLISWRGLAVAFGAILAAAAISVIGVGAIQPRLPLLFGWKTFLWQEWPEVIPPQGGYVGIGLALLVLGVAVAVYIPARRWSARTDFSLIGLVPFAILGPVLASSEPRTAYAFIWPVLIGSLVWIVAIITGRKLVKWSLDITTILAALLLLVILLPFVPGIVMADGMKSLNIIAGIWALLLLSAMLPAIDGLLVQKGIIAPAGPHS